MAFQVCRLRFSCGRQDCAYFSDCAAVRNRIGLRPKYRPLFKAYVSDSGSVLVYCLSYRRLGSLAPAVGDDPYDR